MIKLKELEAVVENGGKPFRDELLTLIQELRRCAEWIGSSHDSMCHSYYSENVECNCWVDNALAELKKKVEL